MLYMQRNVMGKKCGDDPEKRGLIKVKRRRTENKINRLHDGGLIALRKINRMLENTPGSFASANEYPSTKLRQLQYVAPIGSVCPLPNVKRLKEIAHTSQIPPHCALFFGRRMFIREMLHVDSYNAVRISFLCLSARSSSAVFF